MDLSVLEAFAAEVGPEGPVTPVGGRTQWTVGGDPDPGAREVRAPAGVVAHQAEELIVRCRAGTTVADLDAALAARGQMAPLDPVQPGSATVGGVLAVGRSGLRRRRWGPVRDLVLEARWVSAEGVLVRAGAPVVKNVTGFDLCRLMVGSLGTLGVLAEVVLRCLPRPAVARWLRGEEPPDAAARLHRPSSVLWDGEATWVLLEGAGADVDAEARALGPGFAEVGGPPPVPAGARRSLPPLPVPPLAPGEGLFEVGVGVLHLDGPAPAPPPPDRPDLHAAVKHRLDPSGRLNPGRRPW